MAQPCSDVRFGRWVVVRRTDYGWIYWNGGRVSVQYRYLAEGKENRGGIRSGRRGGLNQIVSRRDILDYLKLSGQVVRL